MNDVNFFRSSEDFLLILKRIEEDNQEIFEEAKIGYEECCPLVLRENKIWLGEVSSKLPISIKNLIKIEWEEYCKKVKHT